MIGKREVAWGVVGLFLLFFLYQNYSDHRGFLNIEPPTAIGWGWDASTSKAILTYLFTKLSICVLVSGAVYAFLLLRHRPLNLFLMLLQLAVLIMAFVFYGLMSKYVILAWMMLLTIISQSWKKKERVLRDDLLDDLEK